MLSRKGIFLLFLLTACIDQLVIKTDPVNTKVVIDAFFSNDKDFNKVILTRSTAFSNDYPNVPRNEPIFGATVEVIAIGSNQIISFKETGGGVYITEELAKVGEKYQLEVTLPDGSIYRSRDTEAVPPPVAIYDISFTMDKSLVIEKTPAGTVDFERYFFNVNVHVQDPQEQENYYLWKTSGTFEYLTLPFGDAPCNFCYCWASKSTLLDNVNVLSDKFINGTTFNRKVGSILYDRDTKYLANITQFSINKSAFNFWDKINVQQTTKGGIFDSTPFSIPTNLYREGHAEESVFGFFTVASVTKGKIMINRGREAAKRSIKDPNLIQPIVVNCLELYPQTTHIKPDDFYE